MTAASVYRKQLLEPAMEAQGHNAFQARLACNDATVEVDSIAEHILAAARDCGDTGKTHLLEAARLLRDLLESNRSELALERGIAGTADTLARDAQHAEHAEHASTPAKAWGVKRVARELRAPLADLLNPIITGHNRDQALATVHAILREAPTTAVLCVAVRHELGVKKYSLLVGLHADWTIRGRK